MHEQAGVSCLANRVTELKPSPSYQGLESLLRGCPSHHGEGFEDGDSEG